MENTVSFALDSTQRINFEDYNDEEFAIAKLGFLSTRPNSHKLVISEDVLKNDTPTALGKWLVAKMNYSGTDVTTHTPTEHIMGIIPKDQEIEFVEDEDGYLRAYANVVVSKIYSKEFCKIFENGEDRPVSVEMKIITENGNGTDDIVKSLNIVGVTVLGSSVNPSCPESNIEFVRFAENAETYFGKAHLTAVKKFAEDKTAYKVDKSKEAMSDKPWGDVDKTELRNKIMEASNKASLVNDVYLLVEDGWKEAPSERLKYPVMELKENTLVYNRDGLASALSYAEKENETSVVNKVKKIYKSLDIEQSRKEGESKMAEIEFAAVNIGDMWGSVYHSIEKRDGYNWTIKDIYEENGQKFALIKRYDEDVLYRLDFNLTEEGLTLAEELVKVDIEVVETDEIRKFAEPEDVEKYRTFAEEDKKDEDEKKKEEMSDEPKEDEDEKKDEEMSADEMMAKIAELEASNADKDNIIMQNETELAELREFKKTCMEAERATKVETVMSSVASYMDDKTAEDYRAKGMACEFSQVDAWANEVKASVFDKIPVKKNKTDDDEVTRMSVPIVEHKKNGSVWERL